MARQVIIGTIGQSIQLLETERKIKFKIDRTLGIVSAVLLCHLKLVYRILANTDALDPAPHLTAPIFKPFLPLRFSNEIFEFHEIEFTNAKYKIARRDLIAKRASALP